MGDRHRATAPDGKEESSLTEELDHHCRAGQRCVARTSDGAAITTKPDTLCYGCVQKLQLQYDKLPEIRDMLRFFDSKGLVPSGGAKVSSTPEPSVPINLHVIDLIDVIESLIDDVRGLAISELIRRSDGVHQALAIGRAWKKADGIIGLSTRVWQREMGRCPQCELSTLGSFTGSNTIQCSNANCEYMMTRDEYEGTCLIAVRG